MGMEIKSESSCKIFADYVKSYNEADVADRKKQISEYLEQLNNYKEWVKKTPGFEQCLIVNVWFLEYMGLIKTDNFNGVIVRSTM